jgi:hypothetical protein
MLIHSFQQKFIFLLLIKKAYFTKIDKADLFVYILD